MPGSLSGAIGYRRELAGQRARLLRLGVGLAGRRRRRRACCCWCCPTAAFAAIVPALIVLGLPARGLPARDLSAGSPPAHEAGGGLPEHGAWWVWPAVLLTGVYGGYFGAAQGVLLMAVLGIGVPETLQRLNATKNVLALLVNGIFRAAERVSPVGETLASRRAVTPRQRLLIGGTVTIRIVAQLRDIVHDDMRSAHLDPQRFQLGESAR